MATDFNQFPTGGRTYVIDASAAATAVPLTLACWFNPDNLVTSTRSLVTIERANNGHDFFSLSLEGTGGSQKLFAGKQRGSSVENAYAATTYTTGAWQSGIAVFSADDNMVSYYDGVAGTPNTNFLQPFAPFLDETLIGAFDSFGTFVFDFLGCLARVGIWGGAFTPTDAANYNAGVDPLTIQPSNLLVYLPMNDAATVAVNTQGANFTAVPGAGSFSDCPTSPPVFLNRRFSTMIGPVRGRAA